LLKKERQPAKGGKKSTHNWRMRKKGGQRFQEGKNFISHKSGGRKLSKTRKKKGKKRIKSGGEFGFLKEK